MQSVQDYVLYGRCHVPVIPIIFLVCMQNKKKINLHTNLTSTRNSGLGKFIGEQHHFQQFFSNEYLTKRGEGGRIVVSESPRHGRVSEKLSPRQVSEARINVNDVRYVHSQKSITLFTRHYHALTRYNCNIVESGVKHTIKVSPSPNVLTCNRNKSIGFTYKKVSLEGII